MAFVQMMCARIGMVSGRGLAGAMHRKYPRPLILVAAVALFAANSINVGADLSGMSDAAEMLTHVNSHIFVIFFGVGISAATIWFRYHQIATILKWLALVLFAYVITGFIVHPDWRMVAHAAFVPTWPKSHDQWGMLVAILGTTISPYLFFWQASQEVEEDKAKGRRMLYRRFGATPVEIITRKIDVDVGTFFSNLVMFFIILTTALTLHQHGITHIETSKDAAEALSPLAGKFAATLFTLGIVGTGLLGVPVLAGSAAYAVAEAAAWRRGMDTLPHQARNFYLVIAVSMLIGVALSFSPIDPIRLLLWSAVINGILAPPLIIIILVICNNPTVMGSFRNGRALNVFGGIAAVIMTGSALALIASWVGLIR